MLKLIFMVIFLIFLVAFDLVSWSLVQFMFFTVFFMCMLNMKSYFFYCNLGYGLGFDLMSFGLILLSYWIGNLMILASKEVLSKNYFSKLYLLLMILLILFLNMFFGSLNLFTFYLYFESSLIPILFMIMGWGYQPERLQAGMYMLFYTLFLSLPLLFMIFGINIKLNLMVYSYLNLLILDEEIFVYLGLMMAFLVKLPMYLVHLWLPKAHVEAPVAGSMVLAGVLLKLGGYGLIRMMMLLKNMMSFNFYFIVLGMYGSMILSLICLRQVDLKSLVAYSSVVHMGLMMIGTFTNSIWGMSSAYLMMVGHGLCSSGLFALSNIVYERVGSRSLIFNSGLLNLMPSMSLLWFLFCVGNMAAPPSLNLMAEIGLLNSLIGWSASSFLFLMIISFFSACYSLFLYSYSQHGNFYSGIYSFSSGQMIEFLMLSLHLIPLYLMCLNMDLILVWLI
uniref:NADH-ubiquinone oxidoreductase chain 4 n=1 Tax=Prionoglaris stygia TaxID=1954335 RepID=A0A343QCD0_9NEOP|nr:NADH dehydrogenase subunit 4 [Prionoglaris stygia]ATU07077.1 NADH dehydrogenase subunit 4 [Prionoglaris stygia]